MQAHQHIGTLVEGALHALAKLARGAQAVVGRHREHRGDVFIHIEFRFAELRDFPCRVHL